MHARLSLLMFLNFTILGAWMPVLSLFLNQLDYAPQQSAWIFTTNALGAMLGPLLWGQIADRWLAAQKCISFCCLVSGACLWGVAGSTHPVAVFWGCFAFWVFMIPALSVAASLTLRHLQHPDKEFGKVRLWGTVGWIGIGWLLSAWYLVAEGASSQGPPRDWADALRLGAICAWLTGLYAWTLPHTPPLPRADVPTAATWRGLLLASFDAPLQALQLFRHRSFAVLCVCLFGIYVTFPFSAQLTPLLLQQRDVDAAWLPTILTIAQSLEVATLAALPILLVRLGQKGTMMVGLLAWTLALSLFALGQPRWLVIGSLTLHGVFIGCFLVAGQLFVNRLARDDVRASAQGLVPLIAGLGSFTGHLLVGWIRTWTEEDYAQAFVPAALVAAMLAVMFAAGFHASRR